MKTKQTRRMSVRIDKLTKSIQLRISGDTFDTMIERLGPGDTHLLKGVAWQFDWEREINSPRREVYKLTTIKNPSIIQGLISLEERNDHIFVHLVENAEFNKGRQKHFEGIPGNLFAYACKLSFERGYRGDVAFDSKTVLMPHYEKSLGAKRLWGIRMLIEGQASYHLVNRYFKDFDHGSI
jgi:hypothetical protein